MTPIFTALFKTGLSQHRNILFLCLSALAFQLVYWPVYNYLNAPSAVPKDQVITEFDISQIETPTLDAAASANYETVEIFWRKTTDGPSYYAFKANLDLLAIPDYDIGIGTAFFVDNYSLYINGFLVSAHGRLEHPSTFHGKRREIVRVSRGLLNEGSNEILALATQNNTSDIAVSAMLIGNYNDIMEATTRKRFMFSEYKWITIIISALIALLCLVLLPRTRNKGLPVWLAILAGAICLRIAYSIYFGSLGGATNRDFIYIAVTALIPVAWLGFVNAWCETPVRRGPQRLALASYVLIFVSAAVLIFGFQGRGAALAQSLSDNIGLLLMVITLARLVWHGIKNYEPRYWEFGVLALGVSLTLYDAITFVAFKSDYGHSTLIGLIILLGLVGGILGRSIRIFESLGSLNHELQQRLAIRETEIEQKYAELEIARRQRDIANERQRILRDMHDGIGAQLVVLLSAARSGDLKPDALEKAISQSLIDLRLMIDSLDSASSDLAVALGTFRVRIMPSLEAAGYEFQWDLEKLPIGVEVPPTTILNIYRILQEAIANIIRHADANVISVRVFPSPGADRQNTYNIEIRDNGRGFSKPIRTGGRGLSSMRKRSQEIGGDIDFENTPSGLKVLIQNIRVTEDAIKVPG